MAAPIFNQNIYSASIAEDAAPNTSLGTVAAADPDTTAVTYAIVSGNADGLYAVDASTGAVTTSLPLDFETVPSSTLAIAATDAADETATASFEVTVTNVNEAPVAGSTPASLAVDENLAAGAVVGSVSATDPEGAALTYALTTPDAPFAVSAAGVVTTTAPLDFETRASYTLALTASDGANTVPFSAAVSVTNDADEAPVAGVAASFSVAENLAAGAVVGTVAATDPENAALTYALTTPNVPFAVDAASGRLTTTAALDREQLASYNLAFTASDGANTTPLSAAVSVADVNEAPVAGGAASFTLAENLPAGSVVGTVSADDPENRSVGYTLATPGVPFRVNAVTGQITTTAPLDHETAASYTLAVNATDGANATRIAVAVGVANLDEAPAARAVAPVSLAENLPAGAVVGTVSATDPEGATVGYTLATANVPFAVDAGTGVITTTAPLDREAAASYTLSIAAADATGNARAVPVAVNVIDENEAPVFGAVPALSVAEGVPVGTPVGTVPAADPEGTALAYALSTPDAPFAVDAASGRITTAAPIDFETLASYTLAVSATDATGRSTAIDVPVSVANLDEAPVAGAVEPLFVAENLPSGTVVGTVSASNPEGSGVGYTLATDGVPFEVNAVTGQIRTTAPLDREAVASYALEVEATDGTTTTAINVPVSVTDVDEAPVAGAALNASFAESIPVGTAVGTVSATDPEGTTLAYALTTTDVPFAVDAATGVITTTAALDFEAEDSYALAFTASDGTTAPTALSAAFTVTNVDEAPAAAGAVAPLSVPENSTAGAAVGTVAATDPEGAAVTYALATPDVPFEVSAAGAVTATAPLDREARASYTLTVNATDATGNTGPVTVPVNVTDVNEAPVAGPPAALSVAENLPAGAVVGTLPVSDPEGAALTYTSVDVNGPFAVDSATGQITTTAPLDFEQFRANIYTVSATASDGTDTTRADASILVTDVNEAPVAPGPFGPFSAIEGQAAGTAVGTVGATDPEGRALTYAITSGNDDGAFAVTTTGTGTAPTGQITTTAAFGYGAATSRALTIGASDGTNTLDIPVTVNIEQVPDAPVFTPVQGLVREDAGTNTVLGRFTVANTGGRDVVITPAGEGYAVSSDSGIVTLTAPLDHERAQTLAVSATAAFAGASGPAVRSPAGSGTVSVADVYEPGAPGQSAPPAPFTVNGGVASVRGTSADFRAVDGELAFTSEGGAGFTVIPGVDRALFADGALSFASDTPEAFLQRLYLGLLGREADGRGIAYQADRLEGGATLGQVAQGFAESPEYVGSGAPSDRAFVESLYVNFLDRPADEGGAGFWTTQLASGGVSRGDVAAGFASSTEAQAKYDAQTSRGVWVADLEDLDLDALYLAGLGREADPAARAAVSAALEAGTLTRADLAAAIANSDEYAVRHGSNAAGAVNVIFRDALERDADQAGLAAFVPVYNTQGPAAVLLAITASAEFAAVEEYRALGDQLFA